MGELKLENPQAYPSISQKKALVSVAEAIDNCSMHSRGNVAVAGRAGSRLHRVRGLRGEVDQRAAGDDHSVLLLSKLAS